MSGKILVVDDELLILTAVERALSKTGYIIYRAQNIKELDSALRDAPFDMLITDLYIGEESVDTIIAKVKRTSPDLKILKMSGTVNREKSRDFIEKPFRIEELREKVRALLDEPS